MGLKAVLSTIGLVVALSVSGAYGAELRWPKTGHIAFAFEVPAGWTYEEAGDFAGINANNHESALNLSFVSDKASQSKPLTTLAAEILDASQSEPYSATEPDSIGGVAGTAFISQSTNPGGIHIATRLILVRADPTHVAAMTILMVVGGDPADGPRMRSLISKVHLIGVK